MGTVTARYNSALRASALCPYHTATYPYPPYALWHFSHALAQLSGHRHKPAQKPDDPYHEQILRTIKARSNVALWTTNCTAANADWLSTLLCDTV